MEKIYIYTNYSSCLLCRPEKTFFLVEETLQKKLFYFFVEKVHNDRPIEGGGAIEVSPETPRASRHYMVPERFKGDPLADQRVLFFQSGCIEHYKV